MEMFNPCHPGEILREEILKELNITVTEFAKKIKVSRQVLSAILNEKAGISPVMALRLSKTLGTTPDVWINMQIKYDLWHARQTTNLDDVEVINRAA